MALHGFSGKRQSLWLQLCGQCCHQAASCNIGENLRCVVPRNSTRLTNMLGRLVSGIFQTLPRIIAPNQCPTVGSAAQTGSMIFARTKVRVHWQRPSEHKRITKFGWKTRMSTPNGRKMLMRAILKGKHVLSH